MCAFGAHLRFICCEVSDNHDGAGWRLRVVREAGDDLIGPAYHKEMSWTFDVPAGTYEIYVEAIDHDGNEGSDMVTVYVGGGAPSDTSGNVDDTGLEPTEDPSEDPSDTEDESDSEASGPMIYDPMSPEGCACAVREEHAAAPGLLVLVPLRRRRPRR